MALACIVGIAAGWSTTPPESRDSVVGATFTAVAILVLEPDDAATGAAAQPLTLSELAARATAGEVPTRVAATLGSDEEPVILATRITATTNDEVGTLSISATDSDGSDAALLANSFADELVAVMDARARARHDTAGAATVKQLAKLKAQIEDLSARIGTPRNEVLAAERDAALGRYAAAFNQSQELADLPSPTAGILKLQTATPVRDASTGISLPRSPFGRGAIGGSVGLALGLGLALLAERVDTRIRSKGLAELVFGLPVIAEIPRHGARRSVAVVGAGRDSLYAESYRQLRTSVLSRSSILGPHELNAAPTEPPVPGPAAPARVVGQELQPDRRMRVAPRPARTDRYADIEVVQAGREHLPPPATNGHSPRAPQVVMVTSASPGEGRTTVAANLTAILAETATTVLVLDCDFRHPGVGRMFHLPDRTGHDGGSEPGPEERPSDARADVLAGLAGLADETDVPGVWVARLSPSADTIDAVGAARRLLAEARRYAEVVVIDTPPLLVASVAAALVPDVDGVVVVARAGTTTSGAAAEASERLARLEAPVLGVALVSTPPSPSARRYFRAARPGESSRDRRRTRPDRARKPDRAGSAAGTSPEQAPARADSASSPATTPATTPVPPSASVPASPPSASTRGRRRK